MNFFKNMIELFRDDESGAVTIEYVALGIAVVGLGALAATQIEGVVTGATMPALT